jgi:hypothetical protein
MKGNQNGSESLKRKSTEERQRYLLIGAFILLVILNIILRFPVTPHELGRDSFYIHDLADSIIDSGYIKWAIHPLSYFGAYALSYAAGSPTILAIVSTASDIDISWSIYLTSLLFALFGMFGMYLLAEEFTGRFDLGLLAAFLFSVSALSLKYTLWTFSARGPLLMVLPLFMWCLLRYVKLRSAKYLLLIVVFFSLFVSLHKMAVLFFLIVLGYVLVTHLPDSIRGIKTRYLGWTLIITYGLLFILPFLFVQNEWATMSLSNYVSLDGGWHSQVFGAVTTMGSRLGLLLPLSILGFIVLSFKPNKRTEDWFLIGTTLLFAPLLFYEEYIYTFQLPLLVLLSLPGLLAVVEIFQQTLTVRSTRKIFAGILVMCVIFSSFTLFVRYTNEYESGYGNYMYDSTYAVAQYIIDNPDSIELMGGDSVAIGQLSAFIPNPVSMARSVDYLIFDRISVDALDISLRSIQLSPNSVAGFVRMPFEVKFNDNILRSDSRYIVMSARSGDDLMEDTTKKKIYDNAFDELWYEEQG